MMTLIVVLSISKQFQTSQAMLLLLLLLLEP